MVKLENEAKMLMSSEHFDSINIAARTVRFRIVSYTFYTSLSNRLS